MNKLAFALVSTFFTSTAMADAVTDRAAPIHNALELALGLGFAQGTGDLGGNLGTIDDVTSAGAGLDLAIGWRATPNLLIGGYATLAGFGDRDDASRGAMMASAGIKVDWHFLPAANLDPWISLGTGVKLMGIEEGERERTFTGVELARVQVGLDYRLGESFAIAPTLAVSAARFGHLYDKQISDDAMAIDDEQLHWTVSAGILGRFDAFAR